MYPKIREVKEWVNIYNRSDPISYPLEGLSEKYKAVIKDLIIKGEMLFFRKTSASHVFYWGDKTIAKRIAEGIRRVIEGGWDMSAKILKAVIDRIEEDKAVLEVEGSYEVILPVNLLPEGSVPGNILEINISSNTGAEEAQREKIRKLQERLKGN